MKVLVTGANGFIGKNLISHLKVNKEIELFTYTKGTSEHDLIHFVSESDFVFHLAGMNRPKVSSEFTEVNFDLTQKIISIIRKLNKKIPIVYTSSTQVLQENDYGKSKLAAENIILDYAKETGSPVYIFRMPNVFGKWCRPNYNSAVATFCYNITHDLPIQINDPKTVLTLVYIDDVISCFQSLLTETNTNSPLRLREIQPQYKISLQELADLLYSFKESRNNLLIEKVGVGLSRALYSTYISYLEPSSFKYDIKQYADPRGVFVEMLKTKDSGQISFFTAFPGITRGSHYHHTKTEKFLVIKGKARFGFRHIITNERYTIEVTGEKSEIVETIPGWTHDITNIGEEEMIVMLWANEIFDRSKPDTFSELV